MTTAESVIEDDIDAERESLEDVLQDVREQEAAELADAKKRNLAILRDRENPGASQDDLRRRALFGLLQSIRPETSRHVTDLQIRFRDEFIQAEQSGPLMNSIINARQSVERCEADRLEAARKLAGLEMDLERRLQNAEAIPPEEEADLFRQMSEVRFMLANFDVKLRVLKQKQADAEKELPEVRSKVFRETHAKFSAEIRQTLKAAEARLVEIVFTEEVVTLLNQYAAAAESWKFFGPGIAHMMGVIQQEGPIGGLRHCWGDWRPTDYVIGGGPRTGGGGGGPMSGLVRDHKDSQGAAFGGGGPLDKTVYPTKVVG